MRTVPRAGVGRAIRSLAALAAAAVAVGCASTGGASSGEAPSSFDRHYREGRDSAAAVAFASDSSLHEDADALFRAGFLFADPASPVYDPDAALTQFRRLMDVDAAPEQERAARAYLRIFRKADSLARQLEALKEVDLERPRADTADVGGRDGDGR